MERTMDLNNPTTPGQQNEADEANVEQPVVQTIPVERFNEVYAERQELQRQMQQMMATQNELLARFSQQNAPKEEDPFEGMDPEEAARTRRIIEATNKPLLGELNALKQQLSQSNVKSQFAQAAQEFSDNPKVVDLASKYMQAWQASGKSGWVPEDAVTFAIGQLAREERQSKNQPRNERGQFNQLSGVVVGNSGTRQPKGGKVVDPSTLSPEEQVAYYEQELGDKSF